MKIIAEAGIEMTLVVSTAYENDNVYLIMDFTALMVVYYIDTSYFESIKDDLKDKMMDEQNMELPITNNMTNRKLKDQDGIGKFYLSLYNIVLFVYETAYFHFLPYISMFYCYTPI